MSEWTSPLSEYLQLNAVDEKVFAEQLGVNVSVVRNWTKAGRLPTLPFLYEVERLTSGAVPIESWVAHPESAAYIAKMRAKRKS